MCNVLTIHNPGCCTVSRSLFKCKPKVIFSLLLNHMWVGCGLDNTEEILKFLKFYFFQIVVDNITCNETLCFIL